jgi:hypothetical protein
MANASWSGIEPRRSAQTPLRGLLLTVIGRNHRA